jgi:hypothetical protein
MSVLFSHNFTAPESDFGTVVVHSVLASFIKAPHMLIRQLYGMGLVFSI